ncbi:MAG: voltage-gated potassium channel [Crocinitomicaceae bacterium]|nr:voltage-gated potassium channel [Crocinitomicaceae bacterium]|tara:strand:+ start:11853 stop:12554 length:702 start_codon:yes stop_codon:yes gene_type:complete
MKNFLTKLIIKSDSKMGRSFDIFIQILIILSLLSFSLETLPNLSYSAIEVLNLFEYFTVIVFSTELLLRLILSKSLKYLFTFYGIIDFLAVLPFYLSTGIDLRSVRVFRLFRLLRIFKLFKYNSALNRLIKAFSEIKKELLIFLIATFFFLYLSSIGIYYFENQAQPELFKSVFHSLWWAVTTLTTVGYGDMFPITVGGKLFSTLVVFIGLGIVAIPTGLFASALSKTFKKDD